MTLFGKYPLPSDDHQWAGLTELAQYLFCLESDVRLLTRDCAA